MIVILVLETAGGMKDYQVQEKRTVFARPSVGSSELKTVPFGDVGQLQLLLLKDRSSTFISGSKKAIPRNDGSGRRDSISKLSKVLNWG
jgi:hypothetical protein